MMGCLTGCGEAASKSGHIGLSCQAFTEKPRAMLDVWVGRIDEIICLWVFNVGLDL